ncbi:hypothetical protein TL16_g05413 [Triparma laevis f. inornata]|uniref:Protein kinase domain-containing protein n=1 Tax=Triparma laevis f. inornata TaxID=1714386 RepID=A0A9W7EBV1_9STRA|nr:hypothetical protein TL16_g05413 [Triparma laevis f. inornata]
MGDRERGEKKKKEKRDKTTLPTHCRLVNKNVDSTLISTSVTKFLSPLPASKIPKMYTLHLGPVTYLPCLATLTNLKYSSLKVDNNSNEVDLIWLKHSHTINNNLVSQVKTSLNGGRGIRVKDVTPVLAGGDGESIIIGRQSRYLIDLELEELEELEEEDEEEGEIITVSCEYLDNVGERRALDLEFNIYDCGSPGEGLVENIIAFETCKSMSNGGGEVGGGKVIMAMAERIRGGVDARSSFGKDLEEFVEWFEGEQGCREGGSAGGFTSPTKQAKKDKGRNSQEKTGGKFKSYSISGYKLTKVLGSGAFGTIYASTSPTGEPCAVKRINNINEEPLIAKQTLREIKILKFFNGSDNIIGIRDVIREGAREGFNDVYIVLDLMGTDLQRLIDSKIELDDRKIKHIVYEITLGLIRMHAAKVLHRDLKPGNILIDAEWNVKIADLGLATGENGGNLTEYVVTRWYRSPELLLGMKDYGEGVDIWSVGCIFGELLNRRPMFPGKNYVEQLKLILKTVGCGMSEVGKFIERGDVTGFLTSGVEDRLGEYINEAGGESGEWRKVVEGDCLELLKGLLKLDPAKRISAETAAKHAWLKKVRKKANGPGKKGGAWEGIEVAKEIGIYVDEEGEVEVEVEEDIDVLWKMGEMKIVNDA